MNSIGIILQPAQAGVDVGASDSDAAGEGGIVGELAEELKEAFGFAQSADAGGGDADIVIDRFVTGELADVAGTPMDFRKPTPIGQDINSDFRQLQLTGGFDHNWCIDNADGSLRVAAKTHSPKTGITMTT